MNESLTPCCCCNAEAVIRVPGCCSGEDHGIRTYCKWCYANCPADGSEHQCPRHGGPWGHDTTCVTCTEDNGMPRPLKPPWTGPKIATLREQRDRDLARDLEEAIASIMQRNLARDLEEAIASIMQSVNRRGGA